MYNTFPDIADAVNPYAPDEAVIDGRLVPPVKDSRSTKRRSKFFEDIFDKKFPSPVHVRDRICHTREPFRSPSPTPGPDASKLKYFVDDGPSPPQSTHPSTSLGFAERKWVMQKPGGKRGRSAGAKNDRASVPGEVNFETDANADPYLEAGAGGRTDESAVGGGPKKSSKTRPDIALVTDWIQKFLTEFGGYDIDKLQSLLKPTDEASECVYRKWQSKPISENRSKFMQKASPFETLRDFPARAGIAESNRRKAESEKIEAKLEEQRNKAGNAVDPSQADKKSEPLRDDTVFDISLVEKWVSIIATAHRYRNSLLLCRTWKNREGLFDAHNTWADHWQREIKSLLHEGFDYEEFRSWFIEKCGYRPGNDFNPEVILFFQKNGIGEKNANQQRSKDRAVELNIRHYFDAANSYFTPLFKDISWRDPDGLPLEDAIMMRSETAQKRKNLMPLRNQNLINRRFQGKPGHKFGFPGSSGVMTDTRQDFHSRAHEYHVSHKNFVDAKWEHSKDTRI